MPERRTPYAAALLALALVVPACSGSQEPSAPPPVADASTGASTGASTAPSPTGGGDGQSTGPVVQRTLPVAGGTVEVGLHPLTRVPGPAGVGELVVLTLDLTAGSPAGAGATEPRRLVNSFLDPSSQDRRGMAGALRLLDLRGDRAHLLARDAAGEGLATQQRTWSQLAAGQASRLQAVFAAPPAGVEDLAVLVPRTGLVDALPVVDGPVPPPTTPGASQEGAPLALDSVADAAVRPLEAYSEDLSGSLRTETTAEATEVALAADVLFALDSATLTPEATAVLLTAASDVQTREPGPVSVVGHTDDQGTDAYNLDLSRQRAQAVATALRPLLGDGYPLTVDGRGESEPAVPGTTEQARARNRRVELSVTSPLSASPLGARADAQPPAPELTAPGAQGVVVRQSQQWPFDVRVREARRVQGHLVVDVEVTAQPAPGAPGLPPSPLMLGTFRDPRDFGVTDGSDTARGTVLLQGSTAVFPLFVPVTAEASPRICACGLGMGGALDEGQTLVASVVYPEIETGGTITVQNTPVTSADVPFRLTDVPVV